MKPRNPRPLDIEDFSLPKSTDLGAPDLRLLEPFDLRLEPFDLRPELFDLRLVPLDLRLESFDLRLEPFDLRLEPIDLRLLEFKGLYPLEVDLSGFDSTSLPRTGELS